MLEGLLFLLGAYVVAALIFVVLESLDGPVTHRAIRFVARVLAVCMWAAYALLLAALSFGPPIKGAGFIVGASFIVVFIAHNWLWGPSD